MTEQSASKPKFITLLLHPESEIRHVTLYALDESGDVWASTEADDVVSGWYRLDMTRHPEAWEEVFGMDPDDEDPGEEEPGSKKKK